MKISYNWIKQFLQTDWDATKTGELLTDLGLEVEGIETKEAIKGSLKGIVVGEVLTCIQHPNADRLKITTVDLGLEVPYKLFVEHLMLRLDKKYQLQPLEPLYTMIKELLLKLRKEK